MTETAGPVVQADAKEKQSKLWLIGLLLLIVLNFVVVSFYKPIAPHISVKADNLLFDGTQDGIQQNPWFTIPLIGDVYLTNSLLALIPIFIVIFLLILAVRKQAQSETLQTHGIVLFIEFIISALSNIADSAVDKKWRDKIYPFYLSVFLYIGIANLTKLLPFYETFGFAVKVNGEGGHVAQRWGNRFYAIINEIPEAEQAGYSVISFLRGAATDLNFTIAIAIAAVVGIQVVGVIAHGLGYFNKFINIRALIKDPKMGVIHFIIGILELVAEIAKVASFGFRLFGNIFAGMVLLLFLGYMIPWVVSSFIMLYEVFVGLLQAFIFGMLTAVFMGLAAKPETEH